MGIDLKVKGFTLRVVNAYSPKELHGTDEQICLFYADLKKAIVKAQKHQKLLIGGDISRYKCNFYKKRL